MKRVLSAMFVTMLFASACVPTAPESEPSDPGIDDVEIGSVVDTPDPAAGRDACIDLDLCDGVDVGAADAGEPTAAPLTMDGYVAGAHLLTLTYANMRKSPSADAPVVKGIAPEGGVDDDDIHLWGNPAGMLSPAQVVTLVDPQPQNGFYKVEFDGKTGWVRVKRLVLIDSSMHPVDFAMLHRNAFFKHQLHREKWNKDGAIKSGNCAPTSLAMAVRIFGREPAGLSVEESIHRIRRLYEKPIDEASPTAGTTLEEIYDAATSDKLNLSVHLMGTDHPNPADALEALDKQLAKKHIVALEGNTGVEGAKEPSTYQKAFNEKYAAAKKAGEKLYHTTYMFSGNHSILVLGRDAEGRYVVGDPMSEIGFVTLKAAAMKDYMTRLIGHRGTGIAVWVKQ